MGDFSPIGCIHESHAHSIQKHAVRCKIQFHRKSGNIAQKTGREFFITVNA
jgi:hypothetical protein